LAQKTNALGFRLQINKKWKSRWYNRGVTYVDLLHQDLKIRHYLEKELRTAGVLEVDIERTGEGVTINLHVIKPGLVIGKGGVRIQGLKNEIMELLGKTKLHLNVQQANRADLTARLLAEEIAQQLERRVPYKQAISRVVTKTMESKHSAGVKVTVSGRLTGARIARTEKKSAGKVPLQNITADIDYAQVSAQTKYGTIGIKVWLNRKPEEQYA